MSDLWSVKTSARIPSSNVYRRPHYPTFGREHFFQGLGSLTFFFLWLSFIIFHFQSLIGHFSMVDESLIRRSESGRWKKTTDEDEEWVPTHSFQALIINFGSRVLTFGEQMLRSDSWFVFDDKVVDESLVTLGRWRPIKPWPPTILTDHILSFSLVFDHQVSSLITNRRLHETWKRRKGKDMIWRLMVRG